MTNKTIAAIMLSFSISLSAFAVEAHHQPVANAKAVDARLTDGEVRKVDKETGKVTIKHGPLENLGMPAMTMVFQVKDPGLMDQVKAGDKVRFRAEQINGAYTVMQIEPAK